MADRLGNAGDFENLGDIGADHKELLVARFEGSIEKTGLNLREGGEMNAFFPLAGEAPPDFIGGKGQNRGDQAGERIENPVHGGLGTASRQAPGLGGVKTVLEHIEIERREFDTAEVMDGVVQDVELILLITTLHPLDQPFEFREGPAVDLQKIAIADPVVLGVITVEIAKDVAGRVADAAISIGETLQNLVADTDVVAIILRRHPEAENLGAVFLDHFLGSHDIPLRFRHLLAGAINDKAVGKDRLVGSDAAGADGGQEAGVEPAAMLIRAFEVKVGRGSEVAAPLQNRRMRNSRIEPDIEDVAFAGKLGVTAFSAEGADRQEFFNLLFVPKVAAPLFKEIGDMMHGLAVSKGFATGGAVKDGDRHPPAALATDAPVGAVFDHAEDPFFAPARNPFDIVDRLQGLIAQTVRLHGDEPLLGSAEDHRFFAAPAVRIAVTDLAKFEQRPDGIEFFGNQSVRLIDLDPGKELDVKTVLTVIIDGIIDLQSVTQSSEIVVVAVAGGGVDTAGTGFESDVLPKDDQRRAVIQRVTASLLFKEGRSESRGDPVRFPSEGFSDLFDQTFGNHQILTTDFDQSVGEVGIKADAEIGGDGPGGRRPDDEGKGLVAKGGKLRWQRSVKGELDIDRIGGVIGVFDFGFGEGGDAGRAPVHRLLPLEEAAALGKARQFAGGGGFVPFAHGQVGILPLAKDAEAFEFLTLNLNPVGSISPAGLADLPLGHLPLFVAELLVDHQFDRQTMTVPAWHIRGIKTAHASALDDDILENFIEGMADMGMAVGIRRAIVEDKGRTILSGGFNLAVKPHPFPLLEEFGFTLREVGAHREVGIRQVESLFIVHALLQLVSLRAKTSLIT